MFKPNEIVVGIRDAYSGCTGEQIIHDGAICKVKEGPDRWNDIKVWKSLEREQNDHYNEIDIKHFKLANQVENEGYYKGIRNISEL